VEYQEIDENSSQRPPYCVYYSTDGITHPNDEETGRPSGEKHQAEIYAKK
jgi:hypothetical protein